MRSLVLVIAAGVSISGGAFAQTEAGWILDPRADCRVWYPTQIPDAAVRWTGTCQRGRAQGKGTVEILAGDKVVERYEGPMLNGAAEGRGTQLWANGARYEGLFVGGAPNGRGVTTLPSGARYDGEHRSGLPHGSGVYTWPGGARYEGEFSEGKAHGLGTYTQPTTNVLSASGAGIYSGQWSNGCFRNGLRWAVIGVTARDCGFNIDNK